VHAALPRAARAPLPQQHLAVPMGDFPVPSLVARLFPPLSGRHMETGRIKLQICSL